MTTESWIDDLVQDLGSRRSKRAPWSAPAEQDVQRLEAAVGGPLPSDYRYFVERYGAVILGTDDLKVESPIIEPCPWGQTTRSEYFYPLLSEHPNSLETKLQTYKDRLPRGVIAIVPDAGGNQVCLDVAGTFPGTVWFWDHEQRWFTGNLEAAAKELDAAGHDARRASVHGIIRGWARLHADRFDRPPDYMGMYRMASSFGDFLRSLKKVPYGAGGAGG